MDSPTYAVIQLWLWLSLHKFSRLSATTACCQAPADVGRNGSQEDVATIGSKAWLTHSVICRVTLGVRLGVVSAGLIG